MAKRRVSENGEESRQRILDAAEELFLEHGYDKTSLNAIGKRCGISYGSIPWHFGNKAGLLYAVVDRFISNPADNTSADNKLIPPGITGLDLMMAEQAQWDGNPRLRLLHMLDVALDDAPAELVAAVVNRDQERFRVIEKWAEATLEHTRHESPLSPEGVARVFVASARGIMVIHRIEGDRFDLKKARDDLRATMVTLMGLHTGPS